MHYETVQRIVSAACIPADTIMSLRAGPGSTAPLEFINYETDYGADGAGELVCHVRGEADDLDAAAVALTNSGTRNLQVLAVAANAAILTPHREIVYEPRPGGAFRALRSLGEHPQGARRMIDVDRSVSLIQALEKQPKQDRLLRAAANYGESLRRTEPTASIHALLHLWMAVENLTVVIEDRLKREHHVTRIGDLGAAWGVDPRPGQDYIDDRDVRGLIRRREVFLGDDATHAALRRASDGIEHGFLSFGEARELVEEIFGDASTAVRRSILRESGLQASDVEALMTGIHTRPLPLWRPQLVAEGRFAEDTDFDFGRPIHVRLDGAIRTERIVPEEHATVAAVDSQVRSFEGLALHVHGYALIAPGELRAPSVGESEGED